MNTSNRPAPCRLFRSVERPPESAGTTISREQLANLILSVEEEWICVRRGEDGWMLWAVRVKDLPAEGVRLDGLLGVALKPGASV